MQKIHDCFNNQEIIKSWPNPKRAYNEFIEMGGEGDKVASFLVNGGMWLKDFNPWQDNVVRSLLGFIRPDSYKEYTEYQDFLEFYTPVENLSCSILDSAEFGFWL